MARPFLILAAVALSACTAVKRCAYEGGDRDSWQKPDEVVRALELTPGARVADLGSGGGDFTFRLAEAVGPSGRVFAVDVDEGMNAYVRDEATRRGLPQLAIVLAAYDDPRIPEPVDLIFTSNTYHHLENRPAYFANARRYLRPGGRIAVVEYKHEGFFQWLFPHSTEDSDIRSEMQQAGYALAREHDFLERQHFLIFEPR
jgi:cyclopropane fatty-acyl-phospholipid synthase-like methyltransferase